jgi:hypothetical protein
MEGVVTWAIQAKTRAEVHHDGSGDFFRFDLKLRVTAHQNMAKPACCVGRPSVHSARIAVARNMLAVDHGGHS